MGDNEKKIPKRRFKEFENTETWEQRKLGDVTERITKGTTPIDKNWIGPVNYIKTESIDKESSNLTRTSSTSIEEHEGFLKRSQMKTNDLLFSIVGTLGRVGIVKSKDLPANTNQQIAIIRLKELNPYFVMNALKSPTIKSFIDSETTIGAQPSLSLWQINKMDIYVPPIPEQEKIGSMFLRIDNLITLHQRKLEKMKALKKAYLTEMLPQEGERKPKLRFTGFTDDWEQRKLGDIADVTKLAGFEFTEHVVYSEQGNIIALRGLNVKNGKLVLDDVKYIDGSNFSKLGRSKLFIDDIIFTYVGTVGEVAIIKENDRFYLAPNVSRIRMKSEDLPQYISHYMRSNNFYNSVIFPLIATSSQPALSMENIRKFDVSLPKEKAEQMQISNYFTNIDNIITLHQRKLDKLQNIKKAYLNEMFI